MMIRFFATLLICLFSIFSFGQTLHRYTNRESKLVGFKDAKDKIVVEAVYDDAYPFSDGLALVVKKGKCGYIDKKGTIVIPIKYLEAQHFSEGLAEVSTKKNKWGYIDKTGAEIIPSKYLMTEPFTDGFAGVRLEDAWGFIDKTGKVVVEIKYKLVRSFSEGFARVMSDEFKWGFVNRNGKEIVGCVFDDLKPFSEGLAGTKKGEKWAFIDTIGRTLAQQNADLNTGFDFDALFADSTATDFKYEAVGNFSEGMVGVKINGYWGYLNRNEMIVVTPKYEDVTNFHEGIGCVCFDNSTMTPSWAYVDMTGEFISEQKYESHFDFRDGLVEVKQLYTFKRGFINKAGVEVIPCKYEEVRRISNGFAVVLLNGVWTEIDTKGNEVK